MTESSPPLRDSDVMQWVLAEALRIAPTPIFLLNHEARFLFANQAACALMQQPESLLLQKNFAGVFRPLHASEAPHAYRDILDRAALGRTEAELILPAGNSARVVLECRPFQGANNQSFTICSAAISGAIGRVEQVAQKLLQDLSKEIEFKKASVQLLIERKRVLVGAFGFDRQRSEPWLLRPLEADPIIHELVHLQKLKVLPYTDQANTWEKQPATSDVNSWIGMPLVFEGATIGLVTLDHDQPGFYANLSGALLARLDELAAHAAVEIHEASALQEAKQQIQAVEIIRHVAEEVATKLDTRELLPAITSAIAKGLKCQRCNIFFLERLNGRPSLVCKNNWPDAATPVPPFPVLAVPQPERPLSPVQHAFHTQQPLLIEDLQQGGRFEMTHDLYRSARSMIVVPLKSADQTIGVVSAIHEKPGWFSSADQLLLETLARQAAIAIERDIGLELVHSIGNEILGATKVDEVLKKIVSGAMELTHTDSGVIYLLNEDGTRVIQSFQAEGSIHPKPRLDKPGGITRTVVRTKSIMLIPDIEDDTRVNPQLRGQYRSMFAVPLALGNTVVGVLYLNGKTVRVLTETERSLLSTLADQAALAVQRARLYQRIADSEAIYHSLVDHIPQCVFRKDSQSRFTSANASFCRSLGRELHQIIGKGDFDFYPPDKAKSYVAVDQDVMRMKDKIELDEEHQSLGMDKPIWVRVVKTPVLDATGRVTGVQAIFWDITEQKQMTERWQSLVEQSPDSIVVHEEGRITLANSEAVRLFGVESSDQLKHRSILDFIDKSCRGQALDRLKKLMNKQAVEHMVEMKVRRQSGETVDVEVYGRPGPGKNEVQVVFHDLTRTKTLLSEMHHRVRRCLNQVDGFLELQEDFTNDSQVLRVFDSIRRRIQAMALVHTILQRTGQESQVDMPSYLKELTDAVSDEHDASSKNILVECHAPEVELDEKRAAACGLVVTELVANSLLHAFPGHASGRVSVSLSAGQDRFSLTISDNGRGMRHSPKDNKVSMGLSLVRMLVKDELKGRMKEPAKSSPGTRFHIQFPRERSGFSHAR